MFLVLRGKGMGEGEWGDLFQRFVPEIFFKVFFNIRVCYLFFISLSHLCFKGMFIFYVNF